MTDVPFRSEIPALEAVTYLNTGASGPSPRSVIDAAGNWFDYHATKAPRSPGMYPAAHESFSRARASIAEFIGAADSEIALTDSTIDGLTTVAGAIEWTGDDRIVRTDMEHPAGILPWRQLERTRDVDVAVVGNDDGRIDREAFIDAVSGATLVCFSAVTWNYGTELPVRALTEIAHDAGALVVIDGVQAVGQRPVDVTTWGADAVAAAGHKWMLGPWGGGFLYVEESVAETLTPGSIGYWSVEDPEADSLSYKPGAERFELGTRSPAPHVGVRAAIDRIEDVGIHEIDRRISDLVDYFKELVPTDRLVSPPDSETGLVTVAVDDPDGTVADLADEDIVVRSLPHGSSVRASIHAFNTESDIDRFVDAIGWGG